MTTMQDGVSLGTATPETMLWVALSRGQRHLCDVRRPAGGMTLLQKVVPRPAQPDHEVSLRSPDSILLLSVKAGEERLYQHKHLQVNRRL